MEIQIALAASPLTELHSPKTLNVMSLRHQLTNITELRKGFVDWDIEYDTDDVGKPHHSARVNIRSDMGTGYLSFTKSEKVWDYTGETDINGEVTEYKGHTVHSSVESICRKVRGLIQKLI